jgi:hypothetical protein
MANRYLVLKFLVNSKLHSNFKFEGKIKFIEVTYLYPSLIFNNTTKKVAPRQDTREEVVVAKYTLAYCAKAYITAVDGFIVLAPLVTLTFMKTNFR